MMHCFKGLFTEITQTCKFINIYQAHSSIEFSCDVPRNCSKTYSNLPTGGRLSSLFTMLRYSVMCWKTI